MIPVIETRRLNLRGWRETDLDDYSAMMADEDVTRFVGGVLSRGDAWRGMAFLIGHWELRGYGPWAVERKSDRRLIGRVGLFNPAGWPSLEVIWTLDKPYWRQGYATEAATASMKFGFERATAEK